jgi:ABC-2 type transport system permease protein
MNVNRFAALVRRELWEYRWFMRFPLILSGLFVLFGLIALPLVAFFSGPLHIQVNGLSTHPSGAVLFLALGIVFGLILLCRISSYFLHALHDERMDRSYVFWKSIPVSDTATVGSKVFTGLFIMPATTWLVAVVTGCILLFFLSLITSLLGHDFWGSFWTPGPLVSANLYLAALFFTLPLWFLPVLGWFLFCSAWSNPRKRKRPLLVAIAVPVVLLLLEPIFFGTHVLASWLTRLLIPIRLLFDTQTIHWAGSVMTARWLDWAHLFTMPEFWWGSLAGLLFVALAVYSRHHGESHR